MKGLLLALLGFTALAGAAFPHPTLADHCQGHELTLSSPIEGHCVPTDRQGGAIWFYIRLIVRFLTGIFGLAAVLSIIIGGIQYMGSQGNPQALEGAKKRLGQAIISLIAFILLFAIINYLVPGRVLG